MKRLFILILTALCLVICVSCALDDDPSTSSGQDDNDAFEDDDDDTGDDDDDDSEDDDTSDDDNDDDTLDDDTGDDDTLPGVTCYLDADGDGFGDPDTSQVYPEDCPSPWVDNADDCDDNNPYIFPHAPELADDGIDQDCDGWDLTPANDIGVFVSKTGHDDNPGTMAQPKLTIAAGVALAQSENKVVFVARGQYGEAVATGVALYGGYESIGWSRNIRNYATQFFYQDGTCLVVEGGPIVVEGFQVLCMPLSAYAVSLSTDSLALFHRNAIMGGMSVTGGRAVMLNNIIAAGIYTEALLATEADLVLINSMISGEAGLTIQSSTGYVVSNTFIAVMGKGASSVSVSSRSSELFLIDNIFLDSSPWPVRAISLYQTNEVTLMHNHFWGEDDFTLVDPETDITVINDCTWDSCQEAGGNQFAPPLLSPGSIHLTADSPCIDAGIDPSPWYDGAEIYFDFDGDERPFGDGWDIGMDETIAP